MSLTTGDIYGAIYKKYADTAAVNTLTADTTSMHQSALAKGKDMPYIAVDFVSWVPFYLLNRITTPREDLRVSFAVFDNSRSRATVDDILDKIEAAYGINGTALSFEDSTYAHTISIRESGPLVEWDNKVWHGVIDYLMMFTKL